MLSDSLGIKMGLTAIIGGGGKTTLILRLYLIIYSLIQLNDSDFRCFRGKGMIKKACVRPWRGYCVCCVRRVRPHGGQKNLLMLPTTS